MVGRGHDVHLVTFTPNHVAGVEVHKVRYLRKFGYPFRIWNVKKVIGKIKPDILHAHFAAHYGVYGALSGYHPFVISVYGSDVLRTAKKSRIRKYAIAYALKKADRIAVTAESMKRHLIQNFNLPEDKIVRIAWGVDLGIFYRGYEQEEKLAREALEIEPHSPVVLSNRYMDSLYNQESIISAIPHVLKSCPDAVFIFIRGLGSPDFEGEMKLEAEKLGIGNNVRFIPRSITPNEMAMYLNVADVFLSIPKTDQFGSSVLEGMVCGAIPIVSEIEVYHQYLKDGVNAFFVNPDDSKEIAEKIIYCIQNPKTKNDFYTINKKIVEEKEDWDKNAKKMEELYKQLLGVENS
jgi:glycosyltransferase involved in cell wall biosynthesis